MQSKRCWSSRAAWKCHRMESSTLGLLVKSAAKSLPAAAEQEADELVGAGGCCLCYLKQQRAV